LIVDFISTSEGVQAPLSKLIIGCGYSEISFHFCKDCRIFCEGVKNSTIGISINNGLVGLIGLIGDIGFGLISLVGLSGFSLVGLSGIKNLIVQIGLAGFVGLSGFGLISLVCIIGFDLVGLSGINDLVGLNSLIAAIIAAAEFLVVMAMQAAAAKYTELPSRWQALQNYQCGNLVLLRCIIISITLINSEGEWVVV
jgi:hypothetical protein